MWLKSLFISLVSTAALADGGYRADSHGPIGVMGEHTHLAGEWMLSYRYMHMAMEGNLIGSDSVSTSEIHQQGYMNAPEKMTMKMHMLGGMYAPSDELTLMLMLPLIENEMDLNMRMPMMSMGGMGAMAMVDTPFSTKTDGWGDLKIGSLFNYHKTDSSDLILNFMVSLPTGSIDEKDNTAMSMGNKVQLPYAMQLGSGTYDIMPGITYTVKQASYSWGAQAKATIRLGENDNDYSLGDRYMATAWYARPFAGTLSWSSRLAYEHWDNIDGVDKALNPMMRNMVPTADPNLRAGERVDLALGLNWIIPGSKTNRLALEVIKPIYQHLDGPQMESDYSLVLGWQLSQ